ESLTYQVLDAQKEQYRSSGNALDVNALRKAWKDALRLLKPLQVTIPYVDSIKFPTTPVRARRDHSRFLSLIELSAHIHQFQRDRVADAIIATSNDYRIAFELFVPLMPSNVDQISPK